MPRDQKVLAHDPEKPHRFAVETEISQGAFCCAFCGNPGQGAHLNTWHGAGSIDICRACVRLALYKMAEIPEAQQ